MLDPWIWTRTLVHFCMCCHVVDYSLSRRPGSEGKINLAFKQEGVRLMIPRTHFGFRLALPIRLLFFVSVTRQVNN